ncbi:MAG: hypothetical protein WD824_09625 [Cyclobacteriaceae bacterium]
MLELATKPLFRLSKIASLFEALHENEIMYCHWKSNEHLGASMLGNTDLDVLFDLTQKEKLEFILGQLGFKKFNAVKQKQYNGIVDFIGLDVASGKIIHLHTHYLLTMGEPYLKGYHLNIEGETIRTRVFNEEYGLYCIDPALELILLYLRESLKLRHRDKLLIHFKNRIQAKEYILREYDWLKARTTEAEIHAMLKTIFNDYNAIYKLVTGKFDTKQLYKLAPVIRKEVKLIRLYSPFRALILRWYREATIIASRKLAQVIDQPILFKRNNPRGGIVIAVIGADGSGKSTVTEHLKNTFGEKLDLYKIYFGRGDGHTSFARKLLVSFKGFSPSRKNGQGNRKQNSGVGRKTLLWSLYKCLEAFLVAEEKRTNMRLMQKARKKGALVLCDRYPQNQIMGYNDGPLFNDFLNSSNPLFRMVAKMESGIYAQAENLPPDIVFKLVTDAEVAESRKPGETSPEKLRAKINGLNELKFNKKCRVVAIDATRPLNEVLCTIKKEIWNIL